MIGEISFDLVMDENMDFVEGTYRLPGGDWQVFIFMHFEDKAVHHDHDVRINTKAHWESGITGTIVRYPHPQKMNKTKVLEIMSKALGVTQWQEVHGPDSMMLR